MLGGSKLTLAGSELVFRSKEGMNIEGSAKLLQNASGSREGTETGNFQKKSIFCMA